MLTDDLIFIPAPKHRPDVWGYVFFLPAFLLLAVFLFYPALWALLQSFKNGGSAGVGGSFAGFSAYAQQVQSPAFWRAILNTMYFGAIYVPGTVAAGYIVAALAHRHIKAAEYLIPLFFVPALLPATAAGTIWTWIYAPDGGLAARMLGVFGVAGPDWLLESYLAFGAIAIAGIWQSAGVIAAVFIFALRAMPPEFDDLAALDGLGPLQRFRHARLGPLRNAFIACTVLPMINVYRVFGIILVMTGDGGPANWTTNLPFLVFRKVMLEFDFSAASAIAAMICFPICILVVLLRRFSFAGREL